MTSLTEKLSDIVGTAFEACDLPVDLGQVKISDRPDLAQFQCNGAMAAAKIAKKAPRQIAENIIEKLGDIKSLTNLDIAGPGFINFNITDEFLCDYLADVSGDDHFGIAQDGASKTIIVDYGGPNVAKAMHVGHLRPTIIGDCLKRIVRAAGYNALGDIHMGDWGLPMGQIISELEMYHKDWPYFDDSFDGEYPAEPEFEYAYLQQIYPKASQDCKDFKERLEFARQSTVKLQNGHAGYRALWQHFMTLSKADMKSNFDAMNVHFELWKGESDVNHLIPDVEKELKAKKLLQKSEGALVVPVARDDDNKEMPPLMFYKSNGALTYGTTDLATIYDRIKSYPELSEMIYVVDKRQSLHFEQVFRAAEKLDYLNDDISAIHIGFGTLNGPNGKPFKTRDGGVMQFAELLLQADEKARQRIDDAEMAKDMDEDEKDKIAHMVAVAAIKYTDLSNQSHVDYAFDLDRMTQFEGKTGPYLLYQSVRIKSLLRKAADQNDKPGTGIVIHDEDRDLALLLAELPDVFDATLRNYAPHHLCEYVFRLAQGFSSFYASCHILSEEDDAIKGSRLALCEMTLKQLEYVLDMLGIAVPDRM